MTEPIRYVSIPGSAFTGSTLLAFLLNAHPRCVSVGAATGLIPGVELATYDCSCGHLFTSCPFWKTIEARTRELGHPVDPYRTGMWSTHFAPTRRPYLDGALIRSLRSDVLNSLRDAVFGHLPVVRRGLARGRNATWALAHSVLETAGKSVFVDSARDHLRPRLLSGDPRFDVRVLHLVRDPRANAASIVKHHGVPIRRAAQHWRRANIEADRVCRSLPRGRSMRIRYEELCDDLPGTLDRISDFLEIPRAPAPEDFRATEHHIIGNTMRLGTMGGVRRDDSWRGRLSAADLAVIEEVAGPTSRYLGCDWPAAAG